MKAPIRTYSVAIDNKGETVATCTIQAVNQSSATKLANFWKRREGYQGRTTVTRDYSAGIK